MAVDLAKLVVALELETARYSAELDKAKRQLSRFESGINVSVAKVAKAVGAAAAAAAVGFAAMTRAAINNADQLNDLSKATGISVESLSQLQYVAQQSGTSLEELTTGFRKLNNSAVDAAKGVKAPADAFKQLGISVKNVDGSLKGTEELLLEIADVFSQYEDGAGKAAIAQDLFGKSGASLIPFLNQGRSGVEALKKEADALGLTISGKTAAAADEFNDSLNRMKSAVMGIATQVASELLPTLNAFAGDAEDTAKRMETLRTVAELIGITFKALATAAVVITSAFQQIGRAIYGLLAAAQKVAALDFKGALYELGFAVEDITKNIQSDVKTIERIWDKPKKDLVDFVTVTDDIKKKKVFQFVNEADLQKINEAIKSLKDFRDSLREQTAEMGMSEAQAIRYRLEVGSLADEVQRAGREGQKIKLEIIAAADAKQQKEDLKAIADGLQGINAQILDLQGRQEEGALIKFDRENAELVEKLRRQGDEAGLKQIETLRKLVGAQAEFNVLEKEALRIKGELSAQEDRIRNSQEAGAITELGAMAELDAARTEAANKLDQIAQKQKDIAANSGSDTLAQSAKNASREVENLRAQTDLLEKSIRSTFEEAFGDAFADVITGAKSAEEAVMSFLKTIAAEFAQMAAKDFAQQLFGSTNSSQSGSGGSWLSAIGSIFGGMFADGGRPPIGEASVVGERGPELFVPDSAGTVVPAGEFGGTTNNINLNINAPNGRVSMETQQQLLTRMSQALKMANSRNS